MKLADVAVGEQISSLKKISSPIKFIRGGRAMKIAEGYVTGFGRHQPRGLYLKKNAKSGKLFCHILYRFLPSGEGDLLVIPEGYDAEKVGLLYTDEEFLVKSQKLLKFAGRYRQGMSYSEQGLQGRGYVHFDCNLSLKLLILSNFGSNLQKYQLLFKSYLQGESSIKSVFHRLGFQVINSRYEGQRFLYANADKDRRKKLGLADLKTNLKDQGWVQLATKYPREKRYGKLEEKKKIEMVFSFYMPRREFYLNSLTIKERGKVTIKYSRL